MPRTNHPRKSSFVECPAGNGSLATSGSQACYPGKLFVHVISYRRRLLDEDNLAIKFFIDCLRYAGILSDDSPDKVSSKASQVKVGKEEEEKTIIQVSPI